VAGVVVPNEGSLELASLMLAENASDGFRFLVDLYQNNYTPNQSSTIANFTICDFAGYGQVSFLRSAWSLPTIVSDQAVIEYSYNPISWNNNGVVQYAYGYLVRSSVTNNVLFAEQFAQSQAVTIGSQLSLNLAFQLFGSNP